MKANLRGISTAIVLVFLTTPSIAREQMRILLCISDQRKFFINSVDAGQSWSLQTIPLQKSDEPYKRMYFNLEYATMLHFDTNSLEISGMFQGAIITNGICEDMSIDVYAIFIEQIKEMEKRYDELREIAREIADASPIPEELDEKLWNMPLSLQD